MSPSVDVRLIDSAEPEEIFRLYRIAGWVTEEDGDGWIPAMLRGSWARAGAFADGKLIGFARIISDGISDGYVQDVVVDPAWRRQGIAGKLVRILTDHAQQTGIGWLGLIGVPGTESLYRSCGFEVLEKHTPMRWLPR